MVLLHKTHCHTDLRHILYSHRNRLYKTPVSSRGGQLDGEDHWVYTLTPDGHIAYLRSHPVVKYPITQIYNHINSPQKVRKSNFGPLYLPYNKTKWYCIICHFYHWFVPFTMRYSIQWSGIRGMRNNAKHVACAPNYFDKIHCIYFSVGIHFRFDFKLWQVRATQTCVPGTCT